jgi:hypothetical protein
MSFLLDASGSDVRDVIARGGDEDVEVEEDNSFRSREKFELLP